MVDANLDYSYTKTCVLFDNLQPSQSTLCSLTSNSLYVGLLNIVVSWVFRKGPFRSRMFEVSWFRALPLWIFLWDPVSLALPGRIHQCSQKCSVPEAFECECWKIRYYKQQENWVSTSESIVSVLTESELKEGKRMFICVKHAFAACMEMRDGNEGATRFQCKIWWHFLESWSVPIRWWSSVSAIWKLVTV